jgi:hypothetical protein
MSKQTAVIERPEPQTAVEVRGPTVLEILQQAMAKGINVEQIKLLQEMHRESEANEARKAFYRALAEFKKVPINVTKDKKNLQYESRYTSIGNLVNTVNPIMAQFGLNATWRIDQSKQIEVTCILSHTLGHCESVPMSGPPDTSGKKNELQQIKSTVTYLKSATFQAVTGVIADDANLDDDGNAAVRKPDVITPEQVNTLAKLIKDVGADFDLFLRWAKVETLNDLPKRKFDPCVARLNEMKKEQES